MSSIQAEMPHNSGLPSGYELAERLPYGAEVTPDTLPWLRSPQSLAVARCVLTGGQTVNIASAIGTHPKLAEAAACLTPQQNRNTDNMFYSRLPGYVAMGYASNIEVMQNPTTDFPIHVMRNQGGQRVYFAATQLQLANGAQESVVLRLGACDKNKQALVMGVLSAHSARINRRKLSK